MIFCFASSELQQHILGLTFCWLSR